MRTEGVGVLAGAGLLAIVVAVALAALPLAGCAGEPPGAASPAAAPVSATTQTATTQTAAPGCADTPAAASAGTPPSTNTPAAPVAKLPEISTDAFLKAQGLMGKIVFLEFGMVGCAMSEAGLLKMSRMHRANEIPHVSYVRVDSSKDAAAAEKYFAEKKPGFPVVSDADRRAANAFDATVIPTFVLVDKWGHVRYRGLFPEADQLGDWVAKIEREPADPGPKAALFGQTAVDIQKLLAETKLPNLAGETKPLKDYIGLRGLLVVFVDTTCPYAAQAVSELPQIAFTMGQLGVPSVLVNIGDAKEDVVRSYEMRKVLLPVVYDTTTVTQKNWQVTSVPTVFLFDSSGKVAYRGKAMWADLASATEGLFKLPAGTIKFAARGTEYG